MVVGVNTAIVLHAQDHNMVADLGGAATMLTEQLGLRRPLTIHPGGRDLWCWTSSRDEPDLSKLRTAQPWLVAHNIVAAVGAPALGLDGFCSTHRDALAAQVVALHSRTPEALTLFSEVELLTLLTDAEAMARFVARTLGVLAEPGETNERLRETVHTLLISGSVEATARLLTVHKNTVRYRVDRAEELIGRPVTDTPTETELALRWHARFLAPPPS